MVINNILNTKTFNLGSMTTTATTKPCRYKACKGRDHHAHNEKCPIASSRGSTGGKTTGPSKSRKGKDNGNFKGFRLCGCPQRQHLRTCSLAFSRGPVNFKEIKTVARQARKILNLPEWYQQGHNPAMIHSMIRGVSAVCVMCGTPHKATEAAKIHPKDFNQNPIRSVCRGCDA